MNTKAISFFAILALSSLACGDNGQSEEPTEPIVIAPGDRPITEAELSELTDPVPGSALDTYRAQTITYRSYGSNVETQSAVVTRIDTWEAQTIRVGDTLGRNLRVTNIEPGAVVLERAGTRVELPTNQDVTVEVIKHDIDVAVTSELGHRYVVTSTYLSEANRIVGLGAEAFSEHVDQLGHGALSISALDKGGVIGRLGFQENDILLTINGEPADQGTGSLSQLVRLLASGGERIVQVEMIRGPDHLVTTFVVKDAKQLGVIQR